MAREGMKYANYEIVGLRMIELAKLDASKWPKTVDELRRFLGPSIEIPKRFTKLEIHQGNEETLVINLPARNDIEELEDLINREDDRIHSYGVPDFYPLSEDPDATFNHGRFNFFRSRVAEYTIRGCR